MNRNIKFNEFDCIDSDANDIDIDIQAEKVVTDDKNNKEWTKENVKFIYKLIYGGLGLIMLMVFYYMSNSYLIIKEQRLSTIQLIEQQKETTKQLIEQHKKHIEEILNLKIHNLSLEYELNNLKKK